ncbi:MAG: sucrose-phosphate synthase [Rhodothermales bacterium]|jgi:sucrose-phosphate synthase
MPDTHGIRILILNLHGLLKGSGLEIGRDADNGGQTRYVSDVAQFLSRHPHVSQVDIFTRLIDDPALDDAYSVPVEILNDRLSIHRIPFGGKKYRLKEQLWPFLDDFVAGALNHIREHDIIPDWLHSHYADAGYAATELSRLLEIPFAHTAHSLGRRKMEKFREVGMTEAEGERKFKFSQRIEAEEATLRVSSFVATSTESEIASYSDYEAVSEATFRVLSPGIDSAKFSPFHQSRLESDVLDAAELQRMYWVGEDIERFLNNPQKPTILALSRPDRHKNLNALVKIYGEDRELQSLANLVIYAGIRKDIEGMPELERDVLIEILLLMDRYDLYGKLAIPKKHDAENDVATIYRYCAEKHGVFVNVAHHENFGLTFIEAASTGLPVVATKNGGPSEIIPRCENGILVDPTDDVEIRDAIVAILTDPERWRSFSDQGILQARKYYSWEAHVERYMTLVEDTLAKAGRDTTQNAGNSLRLRRMKKLVVSDIDGTLLLEPEGNPGLDAMRAALSDRPLSIGFGLSSGRSFELVVDAIERFDIPTPDFLICSVGTQIYYFNGSEYVLDRSWQTHLNRGWNRDHLMKLLRSVPWLTLQPEDGQNRHKISFYTREDRYDHEQLRLVLGSLVKQVTLIASHGAFLDVLPRRASKGKALTYLSRKWAVSDREVLVAGDSGNDRDMLTGQALGVVVGNRSPELADLEPRKRLYLAKGRASSGILEGLEHYGWLKDADWQNSPAGR